MAEKKQVELGKVNEIMEALKLLGSTMDLNITVSIKVAQQQSIFEPLQKLYQEQYKKIIEKHGTKDEKTGNIVVLGNNPNKDTVIEEMTALATEKVEAKVFVLTTADLKTRKGEPVDMAANVLKSLDGIYNWLSVE